MLRSGRSPNGSNGVAAAGAIFNVRRDLRDGQIWLALVGELDIGSAPQLVVALKTAQHDGRQVVVDLRGLRFLDSTGLRALLHASQAGSQTGMPLHAVAGPPTVMRVFDLTGTADHFEWIEAPADAVSGRNGRG